ncbi:MAG: hypothetical protein ACREUG_08345 [Steroidobacteraceae bacterium]
MHVGRTVAGEPIYEYWSGEQGERGGLSRSVFRADAYKFTSARSALECAGTHPELRNSENWRLLPVHDQTMPHDRVRAKTGS